MQTAREQLSDEVNIFSCKHTFIGRADFFFPAYSLVVEYDGEGKTRGKYGVGISEAVNKERERERRLRSEGLDIVRVTNESFRNEEWVTQCRRFLKVKRPFPEDQYDRNSPSAWGFSFYIP